MTYSETAALKALAQIQDLDGKRDIVAAGRLGDLAYEDGYLRVILQIRPTEADKFEAVRKRAEATLKSLDGVDRVTVMLTAHKAAPEVAPKPKRSANPHQARRPEGYQGDALVDHVIAVSSAKGGVGKSTVAVNLAVALAKQGKKIGLLDADVHGPSVPMLMGLSGSRAVTTEKEGRRLITPFEAYGVKTMSIGFLTDGDGPIVWRGPMVQGAISRMLWDVDWGELDMLIIDMPPGTGDPQLGLAQDIKPRGALIVSTPQDLALLDALKGVAMFGKVDIPVLGLIENMSVFICPDCGGSHDIFGSGGVKDEASKLGVPLLGQAPLHMEIRKRSDAGKPIAIDDTAEANFFTTIAQNLMQLL
ncbi:MAG: Mrp/NBP35 family ATP-binding protein [Hellea sp.]|nr:Mrp/NBP35 family ATP-binding protein [Hellea sp.]